MLAIICSQRMIFLSVAAFIIRYFTQNYPAQFSACRINYADQPLIPAVHRIEAQGFICSFCPFCFFNSANIAFLHSCLYKVVAFHCLYIPLPVFFAKTNKGLRTTVKGNYYPGSSESSLHQEGATGKSL
jgi:hypothetical protein